LDLEKVLKGVSEYGQTCHRGKNGIIMDENKIRGFFSFSRPGKSGSVWTTSSKAVNRNAVSASYGPVLIKKGETVGQGQQSVFLYSGLTFSGN
jgi:hypothetical protein